MPDLSTVIYPGFLVLSLVSPLSSTEAVAAPPTPPSKKSSLGPPAPPKPRTPPAVQVDPGWLEYLDREVIVVTKAGTAFVGRVIAVKTAELMSEVGGEPTNTVAFDDITRIGPREATSPSMRTQSFSDPESKFRTTSPAPHLDSAKMSGEPPSGCSRWSVHPASHG